MTAVFTQCAEKQTFSDKMTKLTISAYSTFPEIYQAKLNGILLP